MLVCEVKDVPGKFIVMRARKDRFVFKLKAGNGEIIAVGNAYPSADACQKDVEAVKACALAPIEDQTVHGYQQLPHPKYEVYKDEAGEFRFRLKGSDGKLLATGEGYTAKASCFNGIASIGRNAPQAQIVVGD